MKTALATATTSGKTLDDVLLSLRSSPIGPTYHLSEKFFTITQKNVQDNPYIQLTVDK